MTSPTTPLGESLWGSYHRVGTFKLNDKLIILFINIKILLKIKLRFLVLDKNLSLIFGALSHYTLNNITVTPLNNAQPWRFFYACLEHQNA